MLASQDEVRIRSLLLSLSSRQEFALVDVLFDPRLFNRFFLLLPERLFHLGIYKSEVMIEFYSMIHRNDFTTQNTSEYGFSLTPILPYKDWIYDSALTREKTRTVSYGSMKTCIFTYFYAVFTKLGFSKPELFHRFFVSKFKFF